MEQDTDKNFGVVLKRREDQNELQMPGSILQKRQTIRLDAPPVGMKKFHSQTIEGALTVPARDSNARRATFRDIFKNNLTTGIGAGTTKASFAKTQGHGGSNDILQMIDKIKKEKPYMRMQSSVSKSHPKKSDVLEKEEPIKTDEIKLSMKRSNTMQKKTK